jgi:hypothetical protein
MRIIKVTLLKRLEIDWDRLHFCRENKVKYRKHLTVGMLIATIASMVGMAFGIVWLQHAGVAMNAWTAIIWIWE